MWTPRCCTKGKQHKEATTSQGGDERGKWKLVLRSLKSSSDTLSLNAVNSVVGVCSYLRTLVDKREGVISGINKIEAEKGKVCLAVHRLILSKSASILCGRAVMPTILKHHFPFLFGQRRQQLCM